VVFEIFALDYQLRILDSALGKVHVLVAFLPDQMEPIHFHRKSDQMRSSMGDESSKMPALLAGARLPLVLHLL
jgi:hypothetical protein